MRILPSEMPKDACGRPIRKGGWPIHAKGQHDTPDDAPSCHKRRRRKDAYKCDKVTAFAAGSVLRSEKGFRVWSDPSTWLADAWREDNEAEN